jgi:V/A-type H+-transporting ATPase subunit E
MQRYNIFSEFANIWQYSSVGWLLLFTAFFLLGYVAKCGCLGLLGTLFEKYLLESVGGSEKKLLICSGIYINTKIDMENKIQELTEKLLKEGVEKGNAEAEKIIAAANEKAAQIVADAKAQAAEIEATAKKNTQGMEENMKSEIKMYAAQALNALKSEVANVVGNQVVKEATAEVVGDKDFMNEFMLKLAEKWGAQEDIVISTADAKSLKALFAKKAKALLDKGVKIEEVNGQKTLFTVQPADGSYKVNFGEAEFETYFKNFLRPQLVDMIF